MHTEGFQPSRSFWRGHKRQKTGGGRREGQRGTGSEGLLQGVGKQMAALTPCLTLTFSNISMVGKVFKEQTKPSGFRKPATTYGTPGRND